MKITNTASYANLIKKPTVLTIIILMTAAMIIPAALAELTTDKSDYAPTDTVYLTGSGFLPNHIVDLTLSGPEGFTTCSWSVMSDENGNFETTYSGGLIEGTFTLTATDGTTTQTTTFTDALGLNFFGTDGGQHKVIGSIEDLGSISKGTDLTGTLRIQGVGLGTSGSIDWTISWVSALDESTLSPLTTLTPSTGTVDHSDDDDNVGLKILTGSLTVGTTYQGELQVTGTGVSGATLYFFKFKVIAASPANTAPTVNAGADATINEGDTFSSSGSFTDPDADTWTATVDYGEGANAETLTLTLPAKTFSLSNLYEQDGTYTITVDVFDGTAHGQDTVTVTVNNVLPVVSAGPDAIIDEGDTFSYTLGSFVDPGADTWSATVNYGDGSGTGALALSGKTFSLSHTYADNGVYAVTVTVYDDDGSGSDTVQVTVNNVAPTVGAITIIPDPAVVKVGDPVSASASFTDPGVLDWHTAQWSWGDTKSSAGTVTELNGDGSVAGSHSYSSAGVYTVVLTVTDKDGDSGTNTFMYVVVYDPNGGFVTGGGSIYSPAGAYMLDKNLEGKATFGFVSKYLKGANVPTGNTEFQFHAGNLNFKSTSYEWLVVAGTKAMYKGEGTINGAGRYGFLLSAIDGGAKGMDKFRIQIWDKNNGDTMVYDNMLGTAPDLITDPTTIISGSIVVHK